MPSLNGKHIVIIIEGFPVPLFKILMQHAVTLQRAGAVVSVISPKMFGLTKSHERIDSVDIYRYPLPFEANNALGFMIEYAWALAWQFCMLVRLHLKKRVDAIEGCTPPDLVFIPSLPFKLLGARYIYYQLDLNPELYICKYDKKDLFYKVLLLWERITYACADCVIAPNQSFRAIALQRGKVHPDRCTVVRSGPDMNAVHLTDGDREIKKGKGYLIGYLGVVCKQDSLDGLIEIIRIIAAKRQDVHFAIIGDGPELPRIKELARRLNIDGLITFFGMINDTGRICDILSTCDVCVNPDKVDEFNDKITAIKIMEYMALKKPVVQFDLTEARFTARQASLYARKDDHADFASKILYLLDNRSQRVAMGEYGYRRMLDELSWEHESKKLIALYEQAFAAASRKDPR
jgi:glycosyltransferase involved in cell wall biosynthesis